MGKNKTMKMILITLLIAMIALVLVSGTYAKYTSSASVMDFDKAINDASNKWNLLVSVVGTSAALAIASFFVPGSKVTLTALKNGLKALGFTNLLAKADTIVTRWNNYSNAVKNGDNKYNVA